MECKSGGWPPDRAFCRNLNWPLHVPLVRRVGRRYGVLRTEIDEYVMRELWEVHFSPYRKRTMHPNEAALKIVFHVHAQKCNHPPPHEANLRTLYHLPTQECQPLGSMSMQAYTSCDSSSHREIVSILACSLGVKELATLCLIMERCRHQFSHGLHI